MNVLAMGRMFCWVWACGFVGVALVVGAVAQERAEGWRPGAGFRWRDLAVAGEGRTGFNRLRPESTGVMFTNHLAEFTAANNRVFENGSGVALGDVDGDGRCDLYFCRLEGPNVLYRNLGDWRFEDVTGKAGVGCDADYSTGATLGDVDGDGDLDLLVTSVGGGTRLFMNDGVGVFTEVTGSRLVRRFGSTSMALGDMDGDGDLDLYVTNYRTTTYKDRPAGLKVEASMVNGRIVVTPEDRFVPLMPRAGGVEVIEKGERDFLYINTGGGKFSPISWTAGAFADEQGVSLTAPPTDWGLSVIFRDLNQDGHPDLYVCNDFFYWPDRIWLSEGSRRFRAADALTVRQFSLASMGVDVADINRDGHDDIFVADMLSRDHAARHWQRPNMMKDLVRVPVEDPLIRPEVARNTLFLNRGDGTYAEIAQLAGLDATDWSWTPLFLDVDLDGFEDLLITTGNNHDVQDADVLRELSMIREQVTPENRLKNWKKFPRLATPMLAYRNRGDLTFEDVGSLWGVDLPGVGNGAALADLDGDGDLDVVVNRLNEEAGIFRNSGVGPRVAVRLKGAGANTRGIGARITLFDGALPQQSQEMQAGGRYLSGDDSLRVFAGRQDGKPMAIEVLWRSGRRSRVEGVIANRMYEVIEDPAGPVVERAQPKPVSPLFGDVSERLGHAVRREPFDDFQLQPLLSRRLSRLGPGVGFVDVNNDGLDDIVVGGVHGTGAAVYTNAGGGRLGGMQPLSVPTSPDGGGVGVVVGASAGASVLLAGLGSDDGRQAGGIREWAGGASGGLDWTGAGLSGYGPVASADVDGDGDLDLFVGGRVIRGRYPQAPASQFFLREGDRWIPDPGAAGVSNRLGMVSGAVFVELDGSGGPELVLACEWGPVRVLSRTPTGWVETTDAWGLGAVKGWWNGVVSGDFDGDGRMDLAVSNWGRNTRYQRYLERPLRLYHGDLDGDGVFDVVESEYDATRGQHAPWRPYDVMSKAMPFLVESFSTYKSYATASVERVLGERVKQAGLLEANILDSVVLLNRGGRFERRALPVEAQMAPAFGIVAGDFDGDGNEDLFLAQNFFGMEPETARLDAGLGLVLLGDGRGGFRALSARACGIRVEGEGRGAAVGDLDADGRLDLVVAQAAGPTRLFLNREGRVGLRVRLVGGATNRAGVGARVRWIPEGGVGGPMKEVSSGGGYWSQGSLSVVLASGGGRGTVEVIWPGGRREQQAVAAGVRSVEIAPRSGP